MKWIKTGRTVTAAGATTTYEAVGTGYTIESRKRQIPHSNRSGTWTYTSYFVLKDGKELCEKHRLMDAQRFCEEENNEAAPEVIKSLVDENDEELPV